MFRTDVALKEMNRGFLPFTTAFMSFLACLILAIAIVGSKMAKQWEHRLSGNITVQILPDSKAKNPSEEIEVRIKGIRRVLSQTPGVKSFNVMSYDETNSLLKPWIGDIELKKLGLTLPRLITIESSPSIPLSISLLKSELAKYTTLVTVESYENWAKDFLNSVAAGESLLGFIIMLILLTTGLTIAYAAKSGLAVNREVIEIMHMVGAENGYIVSQFSTHMTKMALLGGLGGYLSALIVLVQVSRFADRLDGSLPSLAFERELSLYLLVIPVLAVIIARVTASFVVRRNINGMV